MNPDPHSTTLLVDPAPSVPAANGHCTTPVEAADASRCKHRYENGTCCRARGVASKFGLCSRHFKMKIAAGLPLVPAPSDFEDLSADLLPQPSEFDAALPINQFLSRLLVLVTKGRVTPRRAAVMAYITNQILHSHRAVQRELSIEEEIIRVEPGDMPRPNRDWPDPSECSRHRVDLGDLPRPDRSQTDPHTGPTAIWDVLGPERPPTNSGNGSPK